jgi:hypothetical protein
MSASLKSVSASLASNHSFNSGPLADDEDELPPLLLDGELLLDWLVELLLEDWLVELLDWLVDDDELLDWLVEECDVELLDGLVLDELLLD